MASMQGGSRLKPISDEDLKKLTVGELRPHNAAITLAEYDPCWPELFERGRVEY